MWEGTSWKLCPFWKGRGNSGAGESVCRECSGSSVCRRCYTAVFAEDIVQQCVCRGGRCAAVYLCGGRAVVCVCTGRCAAVCVCREGCCAAVYVLQRMLHSSACRGRCTAICVCTGHCAAVHAAFLVQGGFCSDVTCCGLAPVTVVHVAVAVPYGKAKAQVCTCWFSAPYTQVEFFIFHCGLRTVSLTLMDERQ